MTGNKDGMWRTVPEYLIRENTMDRIIGEWKHCGRLPEEGACTETGTAEGREGYGKA